MPTSTAQWLWFLFFAVGAAGGWMVLGIITAEAWKVLSDPRKQVAPNGTRKPEQR